MSTVHKVHLLRDAVSPREFLLLLEDEVQRLGFRFEVSGSTHEAQRQYKYDVPDIALLKFALNFELPSDRREALIGECFERVIGDEVAISRELYMSHSQMRELAANDSIGTHSHSHVPLRSLSSDAVEREIRESCHLLEQWTGYRPYSASYPYGSPDSYSLDVANALAAAEITFAFTMERAGNRDVAVQPLLLGRYDNNDLPGGKRPMLSLDDIFGTSAPRAAES